MLTMERERKAVPICKNKSSEVMKEKDLIFNADANHNNIYNSDDEIAEHQQGFPGGRADDDKKRRVDGGGGRRGVGTAPLPPRCQAERCCADLSEAKTYHRRHKVCEFHAKASVVLVAGLRQRFCQQCSRFHVLLEFDEAKRSCRRRLAGHNERRRRSSASETHHGFVSPTLSSATGKGSTPSTSSFSSGAYNHRQMNESQLCRPTNDERVRSVPMTTSSAGSSAMANYKHFEIR